MEEINSLFSIVILILSVVVHEVSHGYVAYMLGDDTAKRAGRLTMNPLPHLDLFGSIILPLLLVISNAGFWLAWAKPVPYNPNNLNNRKWGTIWVASAGIIANLAIALFFGFLIRIGLGNDFQMQGFYFIASAIVFINLLLVIFNLIPLPPLDGSKILFSILPARFRIFEAYLEKYSFIVLILFIVFIWKFISPFIVYLFSLITGVTI